MKIRRFGRTWVNAKPVAIQNLHQWQSRVRYATSKTIWEATCSLSPFGGSQILERQLVGVAGAGGKVGGAATTGTWWIVGCCVRPSNVSLPRSYCLGPECIEFQIWNSFL